MMRLFNSFAVLFKIIQVILVLKMTITVNNGALRVIPVTSKTICQGNTFKFECANSSLAMVIYIATYGRKSGRHTLCSFNAAEADPSVLRANDTDDNFVDCTYQDVTLDTMRLCEHRRRCVVTANETYFGNPCKGVYKYLQIIYACGLVITIQENGNNDTNSTEPAATTPIPVTKGELNGPGSGSSRGPISGEASSDSPVVMAHESQPAVMGVAGSLYLWFLHMKENKSAYITVFILSALGAALVILGVVAFFVTAGKEKEFIKLDVIHRPKRFIALPKEKKKINQNGQVEVKEGKEAYQRDILMNRKGPEVLFTAHDVNNQVKKEFNINRFSGTENGTVHKGDPASIHVNPSFNSGKNNNKPSIIITDEPQFTSPANDAVSSLPSTPARSHTSTDPRTGTPRRTRASSTGNVSKSHERQQDLGIINYEEEKGRLPRHLSAGNVSHPHRQVANFDSSSQHTPAAKTLPRQKPGTSNDSFCQSMGNTLPNTGNGPSGFVNNAPQQQTPLRSAYNDAALNQYQNQPNQDGFSLSYGSLRQPAKASHTAAGRTDSYYHANTLPILSGGTQSSLATQNLLSYNRGVQNSPLKTANSLKETNPGMKTPYSNHRETPKSMRKCNDGNASNDTSFNVTTNPGFSNQPGDIWHRARETQLGQKPTGSRSLGSDPNNIPGGVPGGISSEARVIQKRNASKGTLRAPSMGELLSPLDAFPESHANNPSLRSSDKHFGTANSSLQSFPPPPPEMPTDSSDDDLFSIVAEGTYSSAVPDTYMGHIYETVI
ncbi:uncharacterized protein [Montipora foliosa]|uniref:uncharacterized protein n=1 Tax=Montipora foliosa TaxID=591990 RepID=UPI0035F1238F